MAESDRQTETNRAKGPATAMAQDYSLVLMKVIEAAANDPAQLRKLVYVMAWYSLRPEAVIRVRSGRPQASQDNFELEQALELERAIKRVEAAVALQRSKIGRNNDKAQSTRRRQRRGNLQLPWTLRIAPDQSSTIAAPISSGQPPASEMTAQDNALIPWPESGPRQLQRTQIATLERIPTWLDPNVRVSLDTVEYGPVRHRRAQIGVLPFLQLVCAAAIGVALYVGISNWVNLGPQSLPGATNTRAATPQDGSNPGPETAAALKTQPVPVTAGAAAAVSAAENLWRLCRQHWPAD